MQPHLKRHPNRICQPPRPTIVNRVGPKYDDGDGLNELEACGSVLEGLGEDGFDVLEC